MILKCKSAEKMGDTDIQLVIFSSEADRHQDMLIDLVSGLFPSQKIHTWAAVDMFVKASETVFAGRGIFLILIRTTDELEQILEHKERLDDESVILVLPDSDVGMMRQALKLYPRYLSYMKSDYQDIFFVLEKMITKIKNRIEGEYNDPDK